jgi:6,7-dimethyl-8-ribityllumazine synthase
VGEYAAFEGELDAKGMRVAIAVARFNRDITEPLLDGALRALKAAGASDDDVSVWWVPGAFELPVVAKRLADSGRVDAVICLGAVIRGDTAHFEYVAGGAVQGLVQAAVSTGVPVIFGVLTVDSREQALARIGGSEGHKGEEAANTAIETVRLLQQL